MEDFRLKINADLIGKIINIASRCAKFINENFASKESGPRFCILSYETSYFILFS